MPALALSLAALASCRQCFLAVTGGFGGGSLREWAIQDAECSISSSIKSAEWSAGQAWKKAWLPDRQKWCLASRVVPGGFEKESGPGVAVSSSFVGAKGVEMIWV